MAINGTLKILVLKIISGGEKRGSEILKNIEKKVGWRVSPGSFYPLIHELLENEFVCLKRNSEFKVYLITDKGRIFLRDIEKKKEEVRKNLKESIGFLEMLGDKKEISSLDEIKCSCYQYLPLQEIFRNFFACLNQMNIIKNQREIKSILTEATKKLEELK